MNVTLDSRYQFVTVLFRLERLLISNVNAHFLVSN